MALKLSDCSPDVQAAVMGQLAKEGVQIPKTIVTYCMVYQVGGEWRSCPETEDFKAVAKQVEKMQTGTVSAAAATLRGNPPAVLVRLTRTATLGATTK